MRRDEIRGNQPVKEMTTFATLQPAEVNNHRRGIENVSSAKIKLFVLVIFHFIVYEDVVDH